MAKRKRNIYQPITARDWFLYHLFNDREFVVIRKRWQSEVNDVDQERGREQEARQRAELEETTARYVELLRQQFNITDETARKGLRYKEHNRALNGDRVPVADIQGDRVIISIGANTKLEDIIDSWDVWISLLQSKLPNYSSQRENPSDEPLLAYTVYNELRGGRTMVDIHRAYLDGNLHADIPAGYKWLEVGAFRKYYKGVVKGYVDRP